jgi:ribosomal protein S18 acetylase RimI-like enzyme
MNTTTQAVIRSATPADAGLLVTMLLELATHEGTAAHLRSTAADWEVALARPDVTVLLAMRDGNSVGYASAIRQLNLWLGRDILSLDDLYVRESARNHGVGESLMRELARRASADHLTIRWGVQQDNEAGQRFYRRLGATLAPKVSATWTPENYLSDSTAVKS